MKQMLITFLFSSAIMFSCSSQRTSKSYSNSNDDRNGTHSIAINDEHGSLEIKYSGEISLNEAETGIAGISEGGYLKYKKNGDKIVVTALDNGKLQYEINGGGKKYGLTDDEAILLSNAIKTMIEYGIGAKDRVQRIYSKGGSNAVLNEVHRLKSDYVKSIYLEYLVNNNKLSATEMTEVAQDIRTEVGSDFEKASLLKKFSGKYLADATTAKAYLDAVKSINSDFEKANAVKRILEQPLSTAQFTDVLAVSNSIQSDFEKANVLKSVLDKNSIAAEQFSLVLKSTASINSDFEKANVLKQILKKNELPESEFNETLGVINNINSDFEKANVLKEILKKNQLPESQFNTALNVINSIQSDFEKANVLKQVAAKKIDSNTQWVTLLNTSEKVSSDFEKSSLLVAIAEKMPTSDDVKSAYMKAAKSIRSDFEYGKVMRAVK